MPITCPYCQSPRHWKSGQSRGVECLGGKKRQRLRCVKCLRRFSENCHTLNFRLKKADLALNAKIFRLCLEGISNRRIGRFLYISPHCVRLRIRRLCLRAFTFHAETLAEFKINEAICFDGLENFAGSQYDVNNIQQALGEDSLFIYDFNLATMNRHGYMSEWQKRRLREIESQFGRYNPRNIRLATKDILRRLYEKRNLAAVFTLKSDQHFQYRRVVNQDLRDLKIEHITISSKACRNFQNILFPVNHVDLIIRQELGAFSRETISFSKTHAAMCQKYALYMVWKNYMRPQFTKVHVRRPNAHLESPAMHLRLCPKILSFEDIFFRSATPQEIEKLNPDWQHFAQDTIPDVYKRHKQFVRPLEVSELLRSA